MRKLFISLCFLIIILSAKAQITSNDNPLIYKTFPGIDYLFIFNGIKPTSDLTYTGTFTTINWYKFSDPTNSISNQNYIYPEDGTGYILDVDGVKTTIWVIDYKLYKPVLNSFEPDLTTDTQCEDVTLKLDANIPELKYETSSGVVHILPRIFNVTYQTLEWDDAAQDWKTVSTTQTLTTPATQKTVPAPYCNTTFILSGDQYAAEFQSDSVKIESSLYTPIAVICHMTSIVTLRDATNEAERPVTANQVSGSAPLDMQFLSHANEPVAQFYNWNIYKNNELLITRNDKDIRYTFSDAGTYKIKVTASNSTCSYSDSITVTVSESALQIPNVFTPNGDGFNDEFRVAYKSLISFQCWVYNRWGRKVYYWSDPTKGWDGTINGKKASPGPYFYVINAVGSDGIKYKRSGDINLLRGKEN